LSLIAPDRRFGRLAVLSGCHSHFLSDTKKLNWPKGAKSSGHNENKAKLKKQADYLLIALFLALLGM